MNHDPVTRRRPAARFVATILLLLGLVASMPASACTVTANVPQTIGTYSPAAIAAGAVPALQTQAGLTCSSAVLTLLGGNYVRGTFGSVNGMTLKQQGGSATVGYVASADPAGSYRFGQGTTVDYMQNNLLNALGLLGGSSATLPIFVRPAKGVLPAGVYTDRITIDWSWYLCPGIGLAGACVGTPDTGSGRSTLDMILTIGTAATWDPVNGTNYPKELPGGRVRTSVFATNPDIVPLDAGSIALVIPAAGRLIVGLDGDGSGSASVVQFTDGSPASGVTLTYAGPADTTDDVDFSADGGVTWIYVPVAGNLASEAAVTHVRLRPRGSMAKQSAFTVSVPFLVR